MAFTAQDVAKLREQTGAGMMDCKKALTATDGNMEKAAEYLREQGVSVAAKKASRIASEGVVAAYISDDKKVGALVELNCESDFVGKSDTFVSLANTIAKAVVLNNPKDNEQLLASTVDGENVTDLINTATAKIGEKLSLRRFVRYENDNAFVEPYIHLGGKIGVLLQLETSKNLANDEHFCTVAHDIAMHIAAVAPKYVQKSDVPSGETEYEMAILKTQALNEGKPEAVVEKMILGRIQKYYKEICLVEQEFVKNPDMNVKGVVDALSKACSADIKVVCFSRLVMGEGLEKKVDNLADEVAKLQNK